MGHHRPDTGLHAINDLLDLHDVLHPVMDKEDLSAAAYLVLDGLPDDLFVEGVQFSDDGVAVGRGCVDDGKIP